MRAPNQNRKGHILEALPSVRAARAIEARGISIGVAAEEFGLTRSAVHFQLRRILLIEGKRRIITKIRFEPGPKIGKTRAPVTGHGLVIKCPQPRAWITRSERADQAARHAHDVLCTRDRAAAIFRVDLGAVIEAWERLYPDLKRMRVG